MSTLPLHDDSDDRLSIEVHFRPESSESLRQEVRQGLLSQPKQVHPKYLYDEKGSQLFDAICDTPEYYPTRTEHALLEEWAEPLLRRLDPDAIVELGSGAARKTRVLLSAAERSGCALTYVPLDVSEPMLRQSALELLEEYSWLRIRGIVADYTQQLEVIPQQGRRLFLFLGSTLGNFEPELAAEFVRGIAGRMTAGDHLLLGTDLVKAHAVLDAAYNDAQGLTAAFNQNVLRRLNRELEADFDLDAFAHHAQFVPQRSQVEMRLRSLRQQTVTLGALDEQVEFLDGETLLTEISRKFTESSVRAMLGQGGLEVTEWLSAPQDAFGLSLSRLAN